MDLGKLQHELAVGILVVGEYVNRNRLSRFRNEIIGPRHGDLIDQHRAKVGPGPILTGLILVLLILFLPEGLLGLGKYFRKVSIIGKHILTIQSLWKAKKS